MNPFQGFICGSGGAAAAAATASAAAAGPAPPPPLHHAQQHGAPAHAPAAHLGQQQGPVGVQGTSASTHARTRKRGRPRTCTPGEDGAGHPSAPPASPPQLPQPPTALGSHEAPAGAGAQACGPQGAPPRALPSPTPKRQRHAAPQPPASPASPAPPAPPAPRSRAQHGGKGARGAGGAHDTGKAGGAHDAGEPSGAHDAGKAGGAQGTGEPCGAVSPALRQHRAAEAALVAQHGGRGMAEKLGGGAAPLRLIIVGHNPSETTWRVGHAYAHPSNHMWRLLTATGIVPPGTTGCEADDAMPAAVGVGFTDVGTGHPGTKSADIPGEAFKGWRQEFYARMRAHVASASAAIGCTCGACGAPAMVAFSGKRHYMELLNMDRAPKVKRVELGLQPPDLIPAGWPFPPHTQVWVCCSTSGAAPMTAAQRAAPYQAVAGALAAVPWPRTGLPRCAGS